MTTPAQDWRLSDGRGNHPAARVRAEPRGRGGRLLPRGRPQRRVDRFPAGRGRAVLPVWRVRVRLLLPALDQLLREVVGPWLPPAFDGLRHGGHDRGPAQRRDPVRGVAADQGGPQATVADRRGDRLAAWDRGDRPADPGTALPAVLAG